MLIGSLLFFCFADPTNAVIFFAYDQDFPSELLDSNSTVFAVFTDGLDDVVRKQSVAPEVDLRRRTLRSRPQSE